MTAADEDKTMKLSVGMDLFSPVVQPDRFHQHFGSINEPSRIAERAELRRWADGFPDRDGKFVKEFQTTFNSSFWEIYLYALFKEYGMTFDWSKSSPDFSLTKDGHRFIVEATTANAADGKPKEWEVNFQSMSETLPVSDFTEMNKEAMIRLSNALLGKLRLYKDKYFQLEHVKRKPFVIAVAPFEQPLFQFQYDRAIRAVLYDYYVDEHAFNQNPQNYPSGPPGVQLGFVEKANGASVPLGIFNDEGWAEVSAVIFSCVATWGKLSAQAGGSGARGVVSTSWGGKPQGRPYRRVDEIGSYKEAISDGLQVYHNPFARNPLPSEMFRKTGVVQHYFDKPSGKWIYEEIDNCLQFRTVINVHSSTAEKAELDDEKGDSVLT